MIFFGVVRMETVLQTKIVAEGMLIGKEKMYLFRGVGFSHGL
jgi:hypothetical protein